MLQMIRVPGDDLGEWKPIVTCDSCQERIDDARRGNYLWCAAPSCQEYGRIFFTHKRCADAFEAAHPDGGPWLWESLIMFPLFLAHNLNTDEAKAMEHLRHFPELYNGLI